MRYRSPQDGSPIDLQWFENVHQKRSASEALMSDTGAIVSLLCSVCNETNPCAFGNTFDLDGKCDCANGEKGALCEAAPLADGKCDIFFNTIDYDYDGGVFCNVTAPEIRSCINKGVCGNDGYCNCENSGSTGKFCEVTPETDGTCNPYFNKVEYDYDGGDCCHVNATGVRSCMHEGTCNMADGSCICANGASGTFCEITPVNDGKCDPYFNQEQFEYDGGACCRET